MLIFALESVVCKYLLLISFPFFRYCEVGIVEANVDEYGHGRDAGNVEMKIEEWGFTIWRPAFGKELLQCPAKVEDATTANKSDSEKLFSKQLMKLKIFYIWYLYFTVINHYCTSSITESILNIGYNDVYDGPAELGVHMHTLFLEEKKTKST